MKPQRRLWRAGSLSVELDVDFLGRGESMIGIQGWTLCIPPGDIPALVAALLDALDQTAPEKATSDENISLLAHAKKAGFIPDNQ